MVESSHILHITAVEDDENDGVEWTLDCPGVRSSCELWYACRVEGCSILSPYERDDDDPEDGLDVVTRHGVEHQWIEDDWMTRSGRCATLDVDLSEAVWEIAIERGVGDWPVRVDYQGDGFWWLEDGC